MEKRGFDIGKFVKIGNQQAAQAACEAVQPNLAEGQKTCDESRANCAKVIRMICCLNKEIIPNVLKALSEDRLDDAISMLANIGCQDLGEPLGEDRAKKMLCRMAELSLMQAILDSSNQVIEHIQSQQAAKKAVDRN